MYKVTVEHGVFYFVFNKHNENLLLFKISELSPHSMQVYVRSAPRVSWSFIGEVSI